MAHADLAHFAEGDFLLPITSPSASHDKPVQQKPTEVRETIRKISEQNNFPSREAAKRVSAAKPQRQRKTGRNVSTQG
jgi:hypothetical protein